MYTTITNATMAPDTLDSLTMPPARAEVHQTMEHRGGMAMMMRAAPLSIAAGTTLRLAPGGYHVMLTGLPTTLRRGDSLSFVLHFRRLGARHAVAHVITYADVDTALQAHQ
jgi:copper(I)-binding protein